MKPIAIEKYQELSPELLDEILHLDQEIFAAPYPRDKILKKTQGKKLLILIARENGAPVGFKMGYALDSELFYSWMGGVLESHRGQGIARKLMEEQHLSLKPMNFKRVRTKTRNEFRSMLLFNIKIGFEITGTYQVPGESLRIVLEKDL